MKMRDLERDTGVNRETIRVYLREGLLPPPDRPHRNVADYGAAHADGIRAIQRLQKEQGLTLKQIGALLANGAAGAPVRPGAFPHIERLVGARLDQYDAFVPLDSVLPRNPEARCDATALQKIGAIRLAGSGRGAALSRADAELVGIWGDMRAAGFTEAQGFAPSILGFYVEAAGALARTEVERFLSIVSGRLDEPAAAEMAFEAINRMLQFFGVLRAKAVLKELGRERRPARRGPKRRG
ncbi:MAG: MerR family transcriptional regulator [Alphaproteobacteria bacterium]|nr:MerR family transcriptional regulator [Alphaproteobacteria bacterium]